MYPLFECSVIGLFTVPLFVENLETFSFSVIALGREKSYKNILIAFSPILMESANTYIRPGKSYEAVSQFIYIKIEIKLDTFEVSYETALIFVFMMSLFSHNFILAFTNQIRQNIAL